MIKIVSILNAFSMNLEKTESRQRQQSKQTWTIRERHEGDVWEETAGDTGGNGSLPFAVRYIKLVVECFESYHSHFDELARRINRRKDRVF